MRRRKAIQSTGLISVGLLAGCLNRITGNTGGGVQIWNDHDSEHELQIRIKKGAQTRFREEVSIDAFESKYIENGLV